MVVWEVLHTFLKKTIHDINQVGFFTIIIFIGQYSKKSFLKNVIYLNMLYAAGS